jgi:hypothetical protein
MHSVRRHTRNARGTIVLFSGRDNPDRDSLGFRVSEHEPEHDPGLRDDAAAVLPHEVEAAAGHPQKPANPSRIRIRVKPTRCAYVRT